MSKTQEKTYYRPTIAEVSGIVRRTKDTSKVTVKLMKRKPFRKHSLHKKTAASVLLKLFISGNE